MRMLRALGDIAFGLFVLSVIGAWLFVWMTVGHVERAMRLTRRAFPAVLVTLAIAAWIAACLGAWWLR